jgi:drug/metabolite transporter (DMT)-like permease
MTSPEPQTKTSGISTGVLVAIVITVLAWASAFIVIRGTGPYFSGGALALGRLLVGTVVLGVVVLVGRRWVWPTRREWVYIAVFGVAWFGGYNVALNIAEHTLDAGTTAMLVNIGPILIALGAGIFLREGIQKWVAIGAGIAFVGAVLIGVATGASLGPSLFTKAGVGVLWCLLAAVTYATGVLFQKPTLRRLPAAQVTWMGCVIGAIACLPFSGDLIAGLRVSRADARGPARRLDLRRAADRDRPRPDRFRRGPAGSGDRRRSNLPGRGRRQPTEIATSGNTGTNRGRKSGRIASRVFSRPTL